MARTYYPTIPFPATIKSASGGFLLRIWPAVCSYNLVKDQAPLFLMPIDHEEDSTAECGHITANVSCFAEEKSLYIQHVKPPGHWEEDWYFYMVEGTMHVTIKHNGATRDVAIDAGSCEIIEFVMGHILDVSRKESDTTG